MHVPQSPLSDGAPPARASFVHKPCMCVCLNSSIEFFGALFWGSFLVIAISDWNEHAFTVYSHH